MENAKKKHRGSFGFSEYPLEKHKKYTKCGTLGPVGVWGWGFERSNPSPLATGLLTTSLP